MKTFDEARAELDAYMRRHAPPHYSSPCGPQTWDQLRAWEEQWRDMARAYGTPFVMPVSDQYCENTVYLTPEGNHAFRAWHDEAHLRHNLDFTTASELQLARKHQAEALHNGMSREARELLWIDTAKQSEYENATGEFPANQLEFCRFWFARWRKNYVRTTHPRV